MRMVSHGNLCRGGRQGEGGFTIKMSEHPSIHPFSVVSLSLVLYVLPCASELRARLLQDRPRSKSLTFHNRRLMNGFSRRDRR